MPLSRREKKDIRILVRFVHVFCREKHKGESKNTFIPPAVDACQLVGNGVQLCGSCSDLLSYGIRKRFRCPHDPKPMCKKCETQCYNRKYRERVRDVMRFSGPYLIKRGRLELLYHYLV